MVWGVQLVYGGRNETSYFDDLWAYDLEFNSWEKWLDRSSAGPMGRDHHAAVVVGNQFIIYGKHLARAHSSSVLSVSSHPAGPAQFALRKCLTAPLCCGAVSVACALHAPCTWSMHGNIQDTLVDRNHSTHDVGHGMLRAGDVDKCCQ